MTTAEQVVLYQELAAADAPRLVLAFVSIHHAASTLLAAGTDEQRQRHLPAILDGEIWCQGFSEPEAGSDLAALKATARREGDAYVVNGQKVWASGALHSDWCLLLVRTDPDAPKRKGISYLLMDMRSPGLDVRPITQATGEAHFCEIFMDDVVVPVANLVGAENAGWAVAQQTLGAERGMTMLELSERLGNAGFTWLVEACRAPRRDGQRPIDDPVVQDRLAALEIEVTALRGLCRDVVRAPRDRHRRPGRRVDREALLLRGAAAAHGLRRRGRWAAGAHRAAEADLQRLGVGGLGARLHQLVGVDDPRRVERDPALDHR